MLLVTACDRSGGGNEASASGNEAVATFAGEDRNAAATLALAASGPGGCSARWDGQPVTPQQVLERSSALIEHAIQQQGSVANLTEETLPAIAVTAPAGLGFTCVDTYLAPIRRTGVQSVLLTPDGGGEAALADFSLSDIAAPPPFVVLALGAGGRLTWNNEEIRVDALADRMRQLGGAAGDIEAPPGELELRPAREATFGQVHDVLRAVRAGHFRAALLLPSVPPSRPAAAPAVPAASAVPTVPTAPTAPAANQAAPRSR
jgi:hypothetical protein